ncbi:bifunctional TIP49 [Babesia duncani]|uniref:RuvB-like helicase n=1 Tax=Babesia duncani TaxID=323732 RepID=A0AAD9PK39_9APIC|nr:bifunctional TIP49 [Babesia duncani]
MLDIECFSFLSRQLENECCPFVILATNRGITTIRGTDYKSPHGMPLDLLDRLLIIPTFPYQQADCQKIISERANEENVNLDDETLTLLCKIATETSLRYALQLITASSLIAKRRGADAPALNDVKRAFNLFIDAKRSTRYLIEFQKDYMFSEILSTDVVMQSQA